MDTANAYAVFATRMLSANQMGLWNDWLERLGFRKKSCQILVVGLDNAGKTSILHHLSLGQASKTTIPTVGLDIVNFTKSNIQFTAIDMSGTGTARNLWSDSYNSTLAGLIVVIDTSDKHRIAILGEEFQSLVAHSPSLACPVLFYANKSDLSNGLTPAECSAALGLGRIKNRPWTIVGCSAQTGEGIEEGIDWLMRSLL
ncbi:hypothetical protein HDV03_001749 [Kappamyces sp. JEL0829]|nr:hypothetical protein HDV03_001749 [Kappamyces sp. JEL0829]